MKNATVRALAPTRAGLVVMASSLICLALASCAADRPQSTFTKGMDTGITSSDGGSTRALGNNPNVGINSGTARR